MLNGSMRLDSGGSLRGSFFAVLALLAGAVVLPGCTTHQVQTTTQVKTSGLAAKAFNDGGIAFIIPSSVTGQEEDRQALAMGFEEALEQWRPDIRIAPLSRVLSAINKAGLADDYRRMLDNYSKTGIFDQETLRRIAAASNSRFVAQLKLAGFRQSSSGRWGFLGVRIVETRSASLRVFLQIWDSADGSIAWEGSEEVTMAHESAKENNISFKNAVEETARHLVARLP